MPLDLQEYALQNLSLDPTRLQNANQVTMATISTTSLKSYETQKKLIFLHRTPMSPTARPTEATTSTARPTEVTTSTDRPTEATTSTDHSSKEISGITTRTDSTDSIGTSKAVVAVWGTSLQVKTSRTTSSRTVTRTDRTVSIDPTRTLAAISSSNVSETTADQEETSLSSRWVQKDATGPQPDEHHFVNFLPSSSRLFIEFFVLHSQ